MKRGILIRIRASKSFKAISAFMLVSFLNSLIFPMIAKADGPVAPEFSSFQQVNASQMVDPFTGDFSYNLPLLNIPGADGGYPINMVYNAGITPDQEASWVGLGWNLNVGAITRQMRGMPDDFDGSKNLTKEINLKPNVNVEIEGDLGLGLREIFGFPTSDLGISAEANVGVSLIYDSYKGLGVGASAGASARFADIYNVNAGVQYDPNTGMTVSAGGGVGPSRDAEYADELNAFGVGGGIGIAYNSREAALNFNASALKSQYTNVRANYPAEVSIPFKGNAFDFEGKLGPELAPGGLSEITIAGRYNRSEPSQSSYTFPIFGYFYDDHSYTHPEAVRDYSRGKEFPMSKEVKMLSVPIQTYDIYTVNAQGLGITFRPYQSQTSVLTPANTRSSNTSQEAGIELGSGTANHFGANTGERISENYTGKWRNGTAVIDQFLSGSNPSADYEKTYFREIEDVASEKINSDNRFYKNNILRLGIINAFVGDDIINESYNPGNIFSPSKLKRPARDMRSKNIEYFTNAEAIAYFGVYKPGKKDNSTSFVSNNELGAYIITGEDGKRYEFALPVYAKQDEYCFAIDEQPDYTPTVAYADADATAANRNGKDWYYSKNSIPSYATQYNLTAVYSPDYIDIDGNGPSENDLGDYVKFTYEKKSGSFGVRYPYYNVNYLPGNYSNSKDDKASFTYIEREQYYISRIETKTHMAEFVISARNEGGGSPASNHTGAFSGQYAYKLDAIKLYCKADPQYNSDPAFNQAVPVKTVHFDYAPQGEQLCQGAPGSINGKLTLKQVWFEYRGNTTAASSPYTFIYNNGKNYTDGNTDKWGYYKEKTTVGNVTYSNYDNPYVNQKEGSNATTERNDNAGLWSISQIILPSGGTIDVKYETDDYAYVQNKPAMHMTRIMGTGEDDSSLFDATGGISKKKNRIFFELETQGEGNEASRATFDLAIKKAFADEKYLYFRTFMSLKNNANNEDYVNGYAQIKDAAGGGKSAGCVIYNGILYGYVDVVPSKVKKNSDNYVHPITKAAWQYLYNDRPDLFYPDQGDESFSLSFVRSIIAAFQEATTMLMGVYNFMYVSGFSDQLNLASKHPSFIRIPDLDGRMYGGGHRVKSLTLKDNWGGVSSTEAGKSVDYVQTYTYKLADGRSSGVASYEPKTGEDECAMRTLLSTYSGDNVREYNYFNVIGPVCEDFYPAPTVGYSRVVVSNGPPASATSATFAETGAGYEVFEFFTAKDFPVIENYSDVAITPPFEQCIPIPTAGSAIFNKHAFSQGFSVQTNNMHGKPKSQATYREADNYLDPLTTPVSKTEYTYFTETPYNPNKVNVLKNNIPVLFADDDLRTVEMGITRDFYLDMREQSSTSVLNGWQTNTTLLTMIAIPLALKKYSQMVAETKTSSSIKVIHQTGIIQKTTTYSEGQRVESSILAYDAATGQPILNKTNNEFEKPVYSYSYPAHWYYSGMGLASANYRFTIGSSYVPEQLSYFEPGDVVMDNSNNLYWVNEVNADPDSPVLSLKNASNSTVNGLGMSLKVIRSGKRNLLTQMSGNEKFLGYVLPGLAYTIEPFYQIFSTICDRYELFLSGHSYQTPFYFSALVDFYGGHLGAMTNVDNNGGVGVSYYFQNDEMFILGYDIDEGPDLDIQLGSDFEMPFDETSIFINANIQNADIPINSISQTRICAIEANTDFPFSNLQSFPCTLVVKEAGVLKRIPAIGGFKFTNLKIDRKDILHSESYVFSDNQTRVYADDKIPANLESNANANPYKYGKRGRWARNDNYLFYTNRKQSDPIDISKDGTYNKYTPFDWITGINADWWKTNEITKWNVDGKPLETKDIMNIYSSVLYGHTGASRAVIAAAASNCSYTEMAFEGFEDHGSAYSTSGGGHLLFASSASQVSLQAGIAHTGNMSLKIQSGESVSYTCMINAATGGLFAPQLSTGSETKIYTISGWIYPGDNRATTASISVTLGGTTLATATVANTGTKIDGWKPFKLNFTMPQTPTGNNFIFAISASTGTVYADDIRIHPVSSKMITAVYNKKDMSMSAQLDENNYATYYTYDNQGNLIQMKRETERGKQTLKTSWMNTQKQ